jgi:uncharacterized protein (DUF1778 family)
MTTTTLARSKPRRATKRSSERQPRRASTSTKNAMSLRVDDETKSLIDRAARALGQDRTEFMVSIARARATEVLLDQTFFALKPTEWNAFLGALDNPPPPNAKLKALLARRGPWEE